MKKFRKLNEILVEKDLIIQHLQTQVGSITGTPSDDTSTRQLKKENEALKIENIKLQKCYDREKKLVDLKVRENEELEAQMYEETFSEKQELIDSKTINLDLE